MKLAPGEVVWPQVVPLGAVDARCVGEEAQAVVGEEVEAFLGRPSVNLTNILGAAFPYESFLRSFYVLTIWVCNFLAKGFWQKSCS
jgi:hypothetical protein